MPAFLTAEFWNFANAEFLVGVGLVLFFVAVVTAKVPALVAGVLDGKAAKIQGDLDEAARIRTEAEALLASLKAQRADAERQATEMLKAAEADAARLRLTPRPSWKTRSRAARPSPNARSPRQRRKPPPT